ncbi:Argininosuccinate synthase [Fusarium subglutinans]|uniref:Argininosuccinate synthase n=1 Tax=Gibberella subglutinans TaxID=42677 RepID=A0A8H5Q4G7_GIBSU|nr:Argininosuccinate synthase [Fusarium subglutinans]KAF5608951.1 Argininosuccinate synthase [Fusarium subglutinans]
MKFQFIDNDSTQKPGARKTIRSHVMKGKNLGRTIQGRGKRHAASQVNNLRKSPELSRRNVSVEERRKSLDGAVNNVGNALLFPEIPDTDTDATYSINNPYSGKEYTYFSFPVQFTPSMRYYVYEFHTAICNIIYPYMVADQACLHCLLAMAATYLNILRNIPTPNVESIEATRHFSQALRLMNPRLSQPSAAQEDSNIAIIISLAIHSNITQNLTASAMHLQGLDSILTFRPGGISDIRECNRPLLHKICRTDIELAVAQGTRTRFGNAGLTAAAAGPISARDLRYPLNQMSELLRQVTRELLALCRRPGKAKMSGLQYQDVLISMWQRLADFAPLSGTRPQDLMDDVWQLALLAFLVTVTWPASHLKSVHCNLLHKLLKEHIESHALLERGEEYRPLWFWVVLVYGLSLTNGNCDTLVLGELREASELLRITKWEEAKAKLKSFPWIGIVHDVLGRALWELAVISVPTQSFTLIPRDEES